ncbi:MAG: WecB/TagA/CpsF family glycosyltransferase [Verrucomicrobiota bacterium]
MPDQLPHISILGMPVVCADYQTGYEALIRLAARSNPSAVCASNTHIVAHARFDKSFGKIMCDFDMVLPDGMPLIWYMNMKGAQLGDRVYGPYFMQYVLQHSSPEHRHFFFGGKQSTLKQLTQNALELNPQLKIAGAYSPPYRQWTEQDEIENARQIQAARPHYIWVALGGERQERWISKNLHRHSSGVFLAVGDAFELLAGNRPFAPRWIQRSALTWLYRIIQEPGRLWSRYLKYNSLFLWYLLKESCGLEREKKLLSPKSDSVGSGKLQSTDNQSVTGNEFSKLKIAFIGSRGVPARYSGFETVVEELGKCLVKRGHEVTVYNRNFHYKKHFDHYSGIKIRWYPAISSKSFETPLHTVLCLVDALFMHYDVIYLCGVGNAPLSRLIPWISNTQLIINVDGADYRRAKWGPLGRFWLRRSEREAIEAADAVIADNPEIVSRYEESYSYRPHLISYGTPVACEYESTGVMDELEIAKDGYFLFVGRITPENEALLAIEGYLRFLGEANSEDPPKLVIVGDAGYEKEYYSDIRDRAAAAEGKVIFAGARYGNTYRELSDHALAFILPAKIQATRLVLLDQMGFGSAIIYHECEATGHVIGNAGIPFGGISYSQGDREKLLLGDKSDPDLSLKAYSLADRFQRSFVDRKYIELKRAAAHNRAITHFSWSAVTDKYEKIFAEFRK